MWFLSLQRDIFLPDFATGQLVAQPVGIASLRRDYGWRKCRYHGMDGMERWLGLGVMASNLRHLAQATVK